MAECDIAAQVAQRHGLPHFAAVSGTVERARCETDCEEA